MIAEDRHRRLVYARQLGTVSNIDVGQYRDTAQSFELTSADRRRTRRAAQPPARRHPCGVARDGRPESVARASPVSANGLAAAAAEIDLAPRTACARLLHPGGSAEGIEGRRIRPDVGERVLAHRPEFKAGNGLGRVAGQHLASRRRVQGAPPPAADAWLRKPRVIVGHDRVDDDLAVSRWRNSSTVAAARLTCSALGIRAARFFNAQP
jgi:hypothetical protein